MRCAGARSKGFRAGTDAIALVRAAYLIYIDGTMNAPNAKKTFIASTRDADDNSIGLSPELLELLHAKEGDEFELFETDGSVALRKKPNEHDRKIALVDRIMDENRDVLSALAR